MKDADRQELRQIFDRYDEAWREPNTERSLTALTLAFGLLLHAHAKVLHRLEKLEGGAS